MYGSEAMDPLRAIESAPRFLPGEPVPLVAEVPAGDLYPTNALGPLREAAEAIQVITQAPAAIAAQSVLGVAALAVQGLADVETLHGRAPISIYLLTVAESGERKSTCDRLAMRPIREFETELEENRQEEWVSFRNAMDVWAEARKQILRNAKNDPDVARCGLADLGPEPKSPLAASIVSSEPTLEGIVKNMSVLRASIGIFADEGGAFIGGHGMTSENRLRTIAGLSSLWDGSPTSRWRAGDGVCRFQGRRLSCHLMVQPIVAKGLLSDPLVCGQGLLARFFVTQPESHIGQRLRVGHDNLVDEALDRFAFWVRDRLRQPLPLVQGSVNELDPPVIRLADDARVLLQSFYLEVEKAQGPGRDLSDVRPFASKAAEHAARLSGVMTLIEDPNARDVSGETMADAITLVTFYVAEARRLANGATISAETAETERLRRWLLENWAEPNISASDAAQRGPFKETSRAKKALKTLESFGWVIPIEGGGEVLGKHRREAWRIVRGTE